MTILRAGIDLAKNEPPRLSWRPVGVSQTGERSGEFGRLFDWAASNLKCNTSSPSEVDQWQNERSTSN